MSDCHHYTDDKSGRNCKLIADDVFEIIMKNKEELDSVIIYDRDYGYDFFGFKVHLCSIIACRCVSSLRRSLLFGT